MSEFSLNLNNNKKENKKKQTENKERKLFKVKEEKCIFINIRNVNKIRIYLKYEQKKGLVSFLSIKLKLSKNLTCIRTQLHGESKLLLVNLSFSLYNKTPSLHLIA